MEWLLGRAPRIRLCSHLVWLCLVFTAQFACVSASASRRPSESAAQLPKPDTVNADEESAGVFVLFSLCGLTAVGNQDDAHFRLELEGAKVSVARGEAGHRDLLLVDGTVVQVSLVSAKEIGPAALDLSGLDLLRLHQAWEVAHLSQSLGPGLVPQELAQPETPGPDSTLAWHVPYSESLRRRLGVQSKKVTGILLFTRTLGHHILVLSLQGTHDESFPKLAELAKAWMRSLTISHDPISATRLSQEIKQEKSGGERCALGRPAEFEKPARFTATGPSEADHSLRLDEIDEKLMEQFRAVAEAEGGVERGRTSQSFHYINNICRFEFDLPGSWKEFRTQDFNGQGCNMNLTTPEVRDRDVGGPITNAVLVVATLFSADYGRDDMHRRMASTFTNRGGLVDKITPPVIEGALHDHFVAKRSGDTFEGEIVTFRREKFLYQLLFTATAGSYQEGRANFIDFLRKARWNKPPAQE
jgi:hypothetical protein